jgi:dTDP-4-amino-4,6-dideoxygalactose transaminase
MIKMNDLGAQWQRIEAKCLQPIIDYLRVGNYVGSPYITKFENDWCDYTGLQHSIMVNSGTSAFKVALSALKLDPTDTTVFIQNNTWPSIYFTAKQLGYDVRIVPVDEYLQMSVHYLQYIFPSNYHKLCDETVKKNIVVVPTHILGQIGNMKEIVKTTERYGAYIIEDCSQAHGAEHIEGKAGSFGDIAFWSMYPGKNLGSIGESGILSTNNLQVATDARIYVNSGMMIKNHFISEGDNYRPDGIAAIVLAEKLKYLDEDTKTRNDNANFYIKNLENVKIIAPSIYVKTHAYHYFPIYVDKRQEIIRKFNNVGIEYNITYPFSLYSIEGKLDRSTEYIDKILCLPTHPFMDEKDIKIICNIINGVENDE